MPPRDEFKFPEFDVNYPTLAARYAEMSKRPETGITQGGSSRKSRGAKQAATNPDIYRNQPIKET
jgi:hypothetical protein